VLTQDLDMGDAKGKTAVAQQIIPLIEDIQDPVERDHYWQRLAHTLRADERALRQVRRPERKRPPAEHTSAPRPAAKVPDTNPIPFGNNSSATKKKEAFFLSQGLHHPKALANVTQILSQAGQPAVGPGDFTATEDRTLWQHMVRWSSNGSFVTIQDLCDSLDRPLLDRVQYLQTLAPTLDANLDRLPDQLVIAVLDWRIEKVKQLRIDLRRFVDEAKKQGDLDAYQEYMVRLRELSVEKLRLDKARNAISATSRRRAEDAALSRY